MDNHPLKYRKDFKPCKINITAQETNDESTSELGICIVFGLFRGMVDVWMVVLYVYQPTNMILN